MWRLIVKFQYLLKFVKGIKKFDTFASKIEFLFYGAQSIVKSSEIENLSILFDTGGSSSLRDFLRID